VGEPSGAERFSVRRRNRAAKGGCVAASLTSLAPTLILRLQQPDLRYLFGIGNRIECICQMPFVPSFQQSRQENRGSLVKTDLLEKPNSFAGDPFQTPTIPFTCKLSIFEAESIIVQLRLRGNHVSSRQRFDVIAGGIKSDTSEHVPILWPHHPEPLTWFSLSFERRSMYV